MVNTDFMREVADYIDSHPETYNYNWQNCVAGRACRMDGARFINDWDVEALRPKRDDNPGHIRTGYLGGKAFRYVDVRSRAKRLFGIEDDPHSAGHLFLQMPGVVNKHDAHEVARFVRSYADYLDARGVLPYMNYSYLDWVNVDGV